jgi:hypothetical protein
MLEIADHDKRGTTQDDDHSDGAVEVLVLKVSLARLHDQGELRDDESEPEQCDPGPKPREVRAIVGEFGIHWPIQSRTLHPRLTELARPGTGASEGRRS